MQKNLFQPEIQRGANIYIGEYIYWRRSGRKFCSICEYMEWISKMESIGPRVLLSFRPDDALQIRWPESVFMHRPRRVCDRLSTPERFLTRTFTKITHTTHSWTFGHSPEMPGSRQFSSKKISEAGFELKIWIQIGSLKWANRATKLTFFYFFSLVLISECHCWFFVILWIFRISKIPPRVQIQTPKQAEKQLNSKLITAKLQNLQNPLFPRRDRGCRWISFSIEFF